MRIFYWIGGSERGHWAEAQANVWPDYQSPAETVLDIIRGGYRVRVVEAGEPLPKVFGD